MPYGSICKNHKPKTYSGNEKSPMGLGYHAEGEKIGKRMKGKDKHFYRVIKVKTGKKRWQKIKTERTKRGNIDNDNLELIAEGRYEDDPDVYVDKGETWENNNGVLVVFPDGRQTLIEKPIGVKFFAEGKEFIYNKSANEIMAY
jgi:hypothetical protein